VTLVFVLNCSAWVSPSGGLTSGVPGEQTDSKAKSLREHSDNA